MCKNKNASDDKSAGRVLLPTNAVPVKYDIVITPNLSGDFTYASI